MLPVDVGSIRDLIRTVTQAARLILREKVAFAGQQPTETEKNGCNRVGSCFVLIGTRQHGVAVLYETSKIASSNKMQQKPCPITFLLLVSYRTATPC